MDLKELDHIPPWEWEEGTGTYLREVLGDRRAKASDRILAAEFAGEFTVLSDEIAETLLTVVENSDEPAELRCRAVISLGPALEYCDTMEFEDPEEDPISEEVFLKIQRSLRKLYEDATLPTMVRRRVLEAAVRAPEKWQQKAVRAAYYSKDKDWHLTAVFCMRFVRGFEKEIIESLRSNNPDVHYQAVHAAGVWAVDGAWNHIAKLAAEEQTEKSLRLAAIEAIAIIRPVEAVTILHELIDCEDDDIVETAYEAMGYAEAAAELDDLDEEDDW